LGFLLIRRRKSGVTR